jgi:hypothetical protein
VVYVDREAVAAGLRSAAKSLADGHPEIEESS